MLAQRRNRQSAPPIDPVIVDRLAST
jgi:hypothetical protein